MSRQGCVFVGFKVGFRVDQLEHQYPSPLEPPFAPHLDGACAHNLRHLPLDVPDRLLALLLLHQQPLILLKQVTVSWPLVKGVNLVRGQGGGRSGVVSMAVRMRKSLSPGRWPRGST